ncbi:MAG TPA: serine hydroxymethyltransferase, partial [Opitutales bacterium]|nr:serine hydroxymethyltransferase [Opitutales bacterium]
GQGGPLMHIIAAKAVCFGEAMKPSFKTYAHEIVVNCKAFADELSKRGYGLLSGGTDNHLILIDLRKSHPDLTGKQVQEALERANITTNRNTVPGETRSPFQTSGLRLGTAAMTSRGFTPEDFRKTAEAIDMVINNPKDEATIEKAKAIAIGLCKAHPLPY